MLSPEENVGILIDAWKLMVGRLPGSQIEHSAAVATMFANVPLSFLNISVLDQPLLDEHNLQAALAVARTRAAALPHASFIAICEPWVPPDWIRIATESGFAPALDMTGMAAERLLPPRRPLPKIELRRAVDDPTARDLATVNAHAYGMPPELFECLFNTRLWHADSFGYVGYADGRAVSAAATFPVAGTVYVALVATLPDSHGKGYAETVMRRAIEDGISATGLKRVTLHATDMGAPLYRSMGFEPADKIALWMPSGGTHAH